MRVFSEVAQALLSDEEIKVLDKSNKKLNKEVDAIDNILKKIKEKETELVFEVLSKLNEIKEMAEDDIRLRNRKRKLLKDHQEHYFDPNHRGNGFAHFNHIEREIHDLKTMLEDTVEEFKN